MHVNESRRRFLATLSMAGAANLVGIRGSSSAADSLETTTIRLGKIPGICIAPQYVADELLRAEGFTNIEYVVTEAGIPGAERVSVGQIDFHINFAAPLIVAIDSGLAVTVLGGVHIGCFELFGNDQISGISDLRGRSVGIRTLGSSPHVFLSAMAAYVGLDPAADINWVTSLSDGTVELFMDGKIDAFLGFAPKAQELRARGIGRTIVNSAIDRPWSQYYCCLLSANTDFVRDNPIATKRVLRAILKSADLCVSQPTWVAERLVEEGFTSSYDYAIQMLNELPYAVWREYDPEDTLRFYSLRLREAGMVRSIPQKIIADGTNWRFLEQLKRELKA